MVSEKFMIRFNFVVNLIILSSIVFGGLIWADSNGIWHLAEDVRPGTFGADEGGGDFIFPNNVTVEGGLCLGNECYHNYSDICNSWVVSNAIN